MTGLRRVLLPTLVGFLLGVVVFLLGDKWELHVLQAVGDALMIAAVLAAFWHVHEVRELLTGILRTELAEGGFLEHLDGRVLREVRKQAAGHLVRRAFDGRTPDGWESYHHFVETLAFEEGLLKRVDGGSSPPATVWRDTQIEQINITVAPLRALLSQWWTDRGHAPGDLSGVRERLPEGALDSLAARIDNLTTFYVNLNEDAKYPIRYKWWTSDQNSLPWEMLVHHAYRIGEWTKAEELNLSASDDPNGGTVVSGATHEDLPSGRTKVEIHTAFIQSALFEPFLIGLLSERTRGLTVTASISSPEYPVTLDGLIFALGGDGDPSRSETTSLRLSTEGWLLEDHGYVVYWFPAGGVFGRAAGMRRT